MHDSAVVNIVKEKDSNDMFLAVLQYALMRSIVMAMIKATK